MWFNLIINIIVSCIIILVGHHLWIYFKEKYSVKKTKDIVGSQIQKYKNLLETIQQENPSSSPEHYVLNKDDVDDIKQDLELFLQEIPM